MIEWVHGVNTLQGVEATLTDIISRAGHAGSDIFDALLLHLRPVVPCGPQFPEDVVCPEVPLHVGLLKEFWPLISCGTLLVHSL
jgi:hypothetical protein